MTTPAQYATHDAVRISLPDQEVLEHIVFAEGTRCFLIGGVHVGSFANVKEYIVKRSSMPNEVQFDDFGTTVGNVFAVGSADLPTTEVARVSESANPMMQPRITRSPSTSVSEKVETA
ncbi:MAG: hypothetical protein CM15mP79_1930 [Methanobacteriota archaeon]|nr:MAG: hypothetical protein CM15mP79_1930 [Euryarchaeota archaeon]